MPSSDDAIRRTIRPSTTLSDLCKSVAGKTPRSPVRRVAVEAPRKARAPKLPTYKAARESLLKAFAAHGWTVRPGLKVPHATSPDGTLRYWLKPQAVWVSRGTSHALAGARSTFEDMRQPAAFEKLLRAAGEQRSTIRTPPVKAPLAPIEPWVKNIHRIIADVGPEGRFGARKVFIGDAWRAYRKRGGSMGLSQFKGWLVRANRQGRLALHRADLVGAMDPRKVRESEVSYLNATFHFIEDPSRG